MAQDVSLHQQFNGMYDYTAIGNTLNTAENGSSQLCIINTSSSADLILNSNQTVIAAYLYWAGSGNGDFSISLNNIAISAQRTFSDTLDNRVFFAAFADITEIVQNQGNTIYTISDFNLTSIIDPFCPSGTNFAGWAIAIIYEDVSLPLNQLNVYDGLQSVPDFLSITLDNLNVLDNQNAKIGFIAWEGDNAIAVNEQLTVNGNIISSLPLNPPDNAFNGTNSFTGDTNLFNMDIDVYNIQNNISIGDTSANISLTSGQDFVMINNIITVLNSQLPDATIDINTDFINCGSRSIELSYTIHNVDSTDQLPENTPIAFYINNTLIGQSATVNPIAVNDSESGSIVLIISDNFGDTFIISAQVDDDGTMNGIVTEIDEANNTSSINIELLVISDIVTLPNLIECNEGFEIATYDLFIALEDLALDTDDISFYNSISDLENEFNSISIANSYTSQTNLETIYVRVENDSCFEIYQFQLTTYNCPPVIPQGFSPNNDTLNDWFNIQGLYNIFTNHRLKIYNRYGNCIYIGNNDKPWNGRTNNGNLVPIGTYYYVLNLNNPNYNKPFVGWVYVNY